VITITTKQQQQQQQQPNNAHLVVSNSSSTCNFNISSTHNNKIIADEQKRMSKRLLRLRYKFLLKNVLDGENLRH